MSATEMSARTTPAGNERLRTAAALSVSGLLIAALIVAVAAVGTNILGVPTYYGSGVDSRLGAQVARDFLADQDAKAAALSSNDPSALNNHFTGNALIDVSQEISDQSASGAAPVVTLQAGSITILEAQDPVDPSLVTEVQEDGTRTQVTAGGPNVAPTQQSVSFHGNFWLRRDTNGHYLIADQSIQNQPASILPALAVAAAALVAVALAGLLVRRRRGIDTVLAPASAANATIAATVPIDPANTALQPIDAERDLMIRTFGALHITKGGTDFVSAVTSRSVTGFVWLRLFLAAIQDPLARLSRDEIARQVSPRVGRESQLKRLRNVVSRGLPEMPEVLREHIIVEPEAMSFQLKGCRVDAVVLLDASREFERTERLPADQVGRAEAVLLQCQGTFLPEFETVEDFATDRHPTCTQPIADLRDLLTTKRVALAVLVAEAHTRAGQPSRAVSILEAAHSDRPARQDVTDLLAAAYRAAGRDAEAAKLATG
jgi:hypothetical protein